MARDFHVINLSADLFVDLHLGTISQGKIGRYEKK